MDDVPDEHVVDELRDPPQGVGRGIRAAPLVRLREGDVGVREPVELEMVRGIRAGSRSSTTSSSGSGRSTAWRVNAGTHWSVTSTRMPRAPSPSATAGSISAFSVSDTVSSSPSAVTRVAATTWVAMPP
jgi:hypothetical protein